MLSNCDAGEDSCESLGVISQGDQTSQYGRKSTLTIHWMLKLQYFDHLMGRAKSLEKTLMLGKTEDKGEEDGRG